MNWTEIKEKYPKAYDKFREWFFLSSWYPVKKPRVLYDFFDGEELFIIIGRGGQEFFWMVDGFREILDDGGYRETRTEAEEQAFLRAFEILEGKLNGTN